MSHTPAPWHIETVDEVGYSIHGQPIEITGIKAGIHTRIGTVSHVFEGVAPNAGWQPIPEEMNLANARLIAAAPDLISELKNLRRAYVNLLESGRDRILLLGGQCDDVATMKAADPNLRKTDAAIKKAEGQS